MSLPLVRIPWLDLIRAFVAVGRRMSVTAAAQDLCLSQPAMSRQIHVLEERLGVKLFVRGHRAITFTAEGVTLFDVADGLLWQLQETLGALTVGNDRHGGKDRADPGASARGVSG